MQDGRLFDNVVAFGRLLREAGLRIGPAQIVEAARATELVGVRNRQDFFWALSSALVTRPEHRPVFDRAFALFWRSPETERPVRELVLWRRDDEPRPPEGDHPDEPPVAVGAEAAAAEPGSGDDEPADQRDSASRDEVLADKHFDAMSPEELAMAKRQLEALRYDLKPVKTRRRRRDPNGRLVDWRRTLPRMLRGTGAMMGFAYASRREELPALVVICDISGSMQLYSRLLVHFVCALAARRRNTHAFLFGTRLTNISRYLGSRDVGRAVEHICAATHDFDGGTRIGGALAEFNRRWSRRLLSRKSIVALVTDGLEGDDVGLLRQEMDRLHRSCGRLLWLNPLLRFAGFEPRAGGVKTLLAHSDSIHAVHTLNQIADVAAALGSAARITPR